MWVSVLSKNSKILSSLERILLGPSLLSPDCYLRNLLILTKTGQKRAWHEELPSFNQM